MMLGGVVQRLGSISFFASGSPFEVPLRPVDAVTMQGESFLGRKWLIGKKIKKELDKPEGISHAKMV